MTKMDGVRFQYIRSYYKRVRNFQTVEDSGGRGSVGKQLVLSTASTYQLLVKAPSWLHWDWISGGYFATGSKKHAAA